MGIKSTQRITRTQAMDMILQELYLLPNDVLAGVLDRIADSGHARTCSIFDNFIVSEFTE